MNDWWSVKGYLGFSDRVIGGHIRHRLGTTAGCVLLEDQAYWRTLLVSGLVLSLCPQLSLFAYFTNKSWIDLSFENHALKQQPQAFWGWIAASLRLLCLILLKFPLSAHTSCLLAPTFLYSFFLCLPLCLCIAHSPPLPACHSVPSARYRHEANSNIDSGSHRFTKMHCLFCSRWHGHCGATIQYPPLKISGVKSPLHVDKRSPYKVLIRTFEH